MCWEYTPILHGALQNYLEKGFLDVSPTLTLFRANMFEEVEDEEEEEEEVSPLFSDDERVQFMGEKICQMLKVKPESWNKVVMMEPNQNLLSDFFEARVKSLFFTSAAPDVLTVSSEEVSVCVCVWPVLQNVCLYQEEPS